MKYLSAMTLPLLLLSGCGVREGPVEVEVWYSSESEPTGRAWLEGPQEIRHALARQDNLLFEKLRESDGPVIHVDPSVRYQPIEGIGSSLEESTVFNLMRMDSAGREGVLRRLVHPEDGIGMNLMRICIGSSDFTGREFYTYNDMPPGELDLGLEHFSIEKDIEYGIISVLRKTLAVNPGVRFIASPWSPPGWMKTSDSIVGGSFKSEYTDVYARYLRKFVESYAEHDIPVFAITLQNEPLFVPPDYPGCHMTAEQQRDLAVAVRREFDEHGFDTRILIYDHFFDRGVEFASTILSDPAAAAAVYGTAFHSYAGDPEAMSELREAYPDKAIWFTERTYWGARGMSSIIDLFRNWSRTYLGWVTMLDSELQPEQWTGTPGPTWLIQNVADHNEIWYKDDFFLIAQFTRFVGFGAYRIESTERLPGDPVNNAAFLNPDGSVVVVLVNESDEIKEIRIAYGGREIRDSLPPRTVATYRWTLE